MSFNIWCNGGKSLDRCIDAIRRSNVDVVCLQEASARTTIRVAVALGMNCCPEVGVASRLPLVQFNDDTVVIMPREGEGTTAIAITNVHLPAYPYPPYEIKKTSNVADALAAHVKQAESLDGILDASGLPEIVQATGGKAQQCLHFVCGDFNCPSSSDVLYTPSTGDTFVKSNVPWSAHLRMADEGFIDTYRARWGRQPLPSAENPFYTWSPLGPAEEKEGCYDRIDFIYCRLGKVGATGITKDPAAVVAGIVETHHVDGTSVFGDASLWPSDHRAVVTRMKL